MGRLRGALNDETQARRPGGGLRRKGRPRPAGFGSRGLPIPQLQRRRLPAVDPAAFRLRLYPSMKRLKRAVIAAAAIGVTASGAEALTLRKRVRDLPLPGLPSDLDGLTVMHISDVHAGYGPGLAAPPLRRVGGRGRARPDRAHRRPRRAPRCGPGVRGGRRRARRGRPPRGVRLARKSRPRARARPVRAGLGRRRPRRLRVARRGGCRGDGGRAPHLDRRRLRRAVDGKGAYDPRSTST